MSSDICLIDAAWAQNVLSGGEEESDSPLEPDQGEVKGDLRIIRFLERPFRFPRQFVVMKPLPEEENGTVVLLDNGDSSLSLLKVRLISKSRAMPYRKPEKAIKGIHDSLDDDQGLVEVGNGFMGYSGRDYIYSIVKTKLEPSGVQYCLTLHIKDDGYATAVEGFFDEVGTTGTRDAAVFELKRREGAVEITDDGISGWNHDPYDSTRQRGFLLNLSESVEYDDMFPEHPLSVLRRTLSVLIDNN